MQTLLSGTILFQCDDKRVVPCIHVLKAIRMLHILWRNVTPICISRCFEEAGFSMSLTSGNAEMQESSDSDYENDDEIPLANLFDIRTRNRLAQIGVTMDDLVSVECEVVSAESKSDDDIVGDLLSKESDTDDSEIEDEPIEENVPTTIEGLQGLETVRRVLETHENVDEKLFSALAKIEQIFTSKQKQNLYR